MTSLCQRDTGHQQGLDLCSKSIASVESPPWQPICYERRGEKKKEHKKEKEKKKRKGKKKEKKKKKRISSDVIVFLTDIFTLSLVAIYVSSESTCLAFPNQTISDCYIFA